MEPIGRILGHKFLVSFYVTFPCKTTYFGWHTERSRDLSGQSKQTATNLAQHMAFKGADFILLLEKKG